MSKSFKFATMLLTLILSLSAIAFGQETNGSIEGTVRDPNGAAVPGAQVTIVSAGSSQGARQDVTTGFTRTITAGDDGFFRVLEVPVGFYNVSVAATSGFAPASYNNVEVVLGKTTPVNVALATGTQEVSIDVRAGDDAVAIDPTDNKIQTNITAQQAELLPKGTNFTSLLQVAPAVRNEPLAGGFQIDGASGSENTFIIDGQEVTNFRTGTLNGSNNLPFTQVAEVQVKSSGFEAEFGGATGGVINVVTKGGSDDFHGEFGTQFRTAELQAGPRSVLRTATPAVVDFLRLPRDGGTDFFPTASFSGPIVKSKLWFFANYSPQTFNTVRTINYVTSDPVGRRPNPQARLGGATSEVYRSRQRNEYAFARLDASPTDKLRLSGQFTYAPITLRGVLPGAGQIVATPAQAVVGGQLLTGADLQNQQGGRTNSNNVIGSAVYTPTSNLVLSVRAGRSYLNEKLNVADARYSYGIPPVTRVICSRVPTASVGVAGCTAGIQNVNNNYVINYDISTRTTLDADATILVNDFGGRHQFKGGYQLNRITNDTDQGYANTGIIQLFYGTPINQLQSGITPTAGNLGSGLLQRVGTTGAASSRNDALYIQDKYQPFNRLSLNIGVRVEQENVPSFTDNGTEIKFNFFDKIAPRLGAAFDLTGDGKTKVFVSYGQFYDRFKYELPRGSFGGDFFRRDFFEILPGQPTNFESFTRGRIIGNTPNDPIGGNCPATGSSGTGGISRCQIDYRVPSNISGGALAIAGGIDPDLKPFRQSEITVGFERDLGFAGLLASGRYTHKNVDRAVEDIGFFNTQGSETYIIGNPGFGSTTTLFQQAGFPATPKAIRKYDALEVRLDKRFTQSFYFNANYTFSRLYGNYPGLASSDEAGRNSPNVNRLFDLPFVAFLPGGASNEGRLSTDRPHAFKFYGAYTLNEGGGNNTEFGGFFTAQSGTPQSTTFIFEGVTSTFLNGRGDLGRTPAFTQTDFSIRHKYRFGRDDKFTFVADLDVLNLLNENNVLGINGLFDSVTDAAGLVAGDTDAQVIQSYFRTGARELITSGLTREAIYLQPNNFQRPREVRFGFRFLF